MEQTLSSISPMELYGRLGTASAPTVVVPIVQMGFVVTVVLGIVVMKEPLSRRRAVGLAAAAGTILLFAAS